MLPHSNFLPSGKRRHGVFGASARVCRDARAVLADKNIITPLKAQVDV